MKEDKQKYCFSNFDMIGNIITCLKDSENNTPKVQCFLFKTDFHLIYPSRYATIFNFLLNALRYTMIFVDLTSLKDVSKRIKNRKQPWRLNMLTHVLLFYLLLIADFVVDFSCFSLRTYSLNFSIPRILLCSRINNVFAIGWSEYLVYSGHTRPSGNNEAIAMLTKSLFRSHYCWRIALFSLCDNILVIGVFVSQ